MTTRSGSPIQNHFTRWSASLAILMALAVLIPTTAKSEDATTEADKFDRVEIEDQYGENNPQEFSMKHMIKHMDDNLKQGKDFVCSLGYLATKSGRHVDAMKIFKTCSDHGNKASKIWMSYMHQNGFGVKKDADESTRWVEKSAKEGYSIGKYNYGLALIKGYGVKRDVNAGKALIDEVAAEGDIHAIELKENNYNPDVVTPDADQNDTQPLF